MPRRFFWRTCGDSHLLPLPVCRQGLLQSKTRTNSHRGENTQSFTLELTHTSRSRQDFGHQASRNKCIASSNKCLTSSNKCHASRNKCLFFSLFLRLPYNPVLSWISRSLWAPIWLASNPNYNHKTQRASMPRRVRKQAARAPHALKPHSGHRLERECMRQAELWFLSYWPDV